MLKTSEVAYRLKIELKLKKRVRACQLLEYTEQCGAVSENVYGRLIYYWSDEAYEKLKQVFEHE